MFKLEWLLCPSRTIICGGHTAQATLKSQRKSNSELAGEHLNSILRCKVHLKTTNNDPWFSSLWTLQEAYSSPAAILLILEAVPIFEQIYEAVTLFDLGLACQHIRNFCTTLWSPASSKNFL